VVSVISILGCVQNKSIYIKMNRRSLVSLKNRKSCPENWKIREKVKVLFSVGTAGTIRQIVFFNVRNNPYEVFM
jgi:hypothetical protein